MPVRFKGKSEYHTQYNWVESFRSKKYNPSSEQAVPHAGLRSVEAMTSEYRENFKPFTMNPVSNNYTQKTSAQVAPWEGAEVGKCIEPPIQHKKRLSGPTTSMSCDFYERSPPQEYVLLGQQDKFSTNNVRYIPKKKLNMDNVNRSDTNSHFIQPRPDEPVRSLETYSQKLNQENEMKPPANVNKAPKVNTTKYTDPPTPLAPRQPKYVTENQQTQTVEREYEPQEKKTVKKSSSEPVLNEQTKSQNAERKNVPKKVTKGNVHKKRDEIVYKADMKDKNLSDVLATEKKSRKENMNAFTQTNFKKGIHDSAPEAVSDYVLQYKAGVAPMRKSRKWSEYQREFEWKNRVPDSPLLKADEIVHKSSTTLVAPKGAPKPRASEYKSQFKAWKIKPVERKEDKDEPEVKKAKIKRSKSMGALGDRNNIDDLKQGERKSLKDKSQVAEVIKSNHGKLRRRESEYLSNFKPPSQFEYRNGAWQGAKPPHLYSSKAKEEKQNDETKEKPLSNWYGEVLELRQKAAEYRKRAQGTHFSRAHLAQLFAKQTEMWDSDTCSNTDRSSTISALSLETGSLPINKPHKLELKERTLKKIGQIKQLKERIISDMDSTKATIAESPSTSDYDEAERRNYKPYLDDIKNQRPRRVKTAWRYTEQERTSNDGQDGDDINNTTVKQDYSTNACVDQDYRTNNYQTEGRLPTPQLQKMNKTVPRHHFDRTTPSVGGAILSSPPDVRHRPMKNYYMKENTSIANYENDMSDEEEEARIIGKAYNLIKMTPKPTYGQPSKDTHVLLDEEASTDRPMKTQFINTQIYEEDFPVESELPPPRYLPEPKNKKPSSAPVMEAINENFGQTYNKPYVPPIYSYNDVENYYHDDDDDVLSTSVRSIASSCSLASELLERTRERRDNFWRNTRVPTQ